jgi:hypothetical protein
MATTLSEDVRLLVSSLPQPLTAAQRVEADLATHLAERIDGGEVEDRYIAAVVRELRVLVSGLHAGGAQVDAFAELARQLSAEVVDAAD